MKLLSKLTAVTAILLLSASAFAQVNAIDFSEKLESARKLYFNGSYFAAEKVFNELSNEMGKVATPELTEVEAYKVLCAIATDKVNMAGLVNNFLHNYPNAPQINKIKHAMASRYFDKGEYATALEVFDQIDRRHIFSRSRTDFDFKKAYCQMRTGNNEDAIKTFTAIKNAEYSNFTVPSTYYLAYTYYIEKKFQEASPLFEECFADQRFSLMAKYYAVESHFMMKDYNYVVSYGPSLMQDLDRDLQINLAKILSETYYAEGLPETAQQYLDLYMNSGNELSRKDYYFSGILSYSLHSYQDAIKNFEKVLGVDDELSQNAYYYAANSYLQTKNKITALEYFKKASESDFDKVIKEDALFNFAKLSFDVNTDISQFTHYMEIYPDNGKDDIINGYMAASFILSKDYRSAVDVLTKIKNHTSESSANLQKAAFFRAVQFMGNGGYRSAIPMLELSIEYGASNEDLLNLAKNRILGIDKRLKFFDIIIVHFLKFDL